MTGRRKLQVAAAVLAILAVHPDLMSSQNRDTLETEVTASGSEVVFKWSKRHPWDAELVGRGASLWAEYRTARNAGLECMQDSGADPDPRGIRGGAGRGNCFSGTTVMRKEDRTIRFKLPASLLAEPTGPVCLQLRLTDQRLIPIRRATREGGDTARFQYEPWSQNASRRARVSALELKRVELQTAIATQTAAITEQESSNLRQKWGSADACSNLAEPSVDLAPSNRPIAVPAEQDHRARMTCVVRLSNSSGRINRANPPTDLIEFLDDADPVMLARWKKVRQNQIDSFVNDWLTLSPRIATFKSTEAPTPYFGDYTDYLSLQSLTIEAGRRVMAARKAGTAPDSADVLGFFGGAVEAYDRCVRDGKRQLDLNYRQAQSLKATVQTLPSRIREQDVRECQNAVTKLDGMRARLAAYQRDLAILEQDVAKISVGQPGAARVNLNAISCSP